MISLSSVKAQLRLERDDDSEDELLANLVAVAIECAESYLNRKIYATSTELSADANAPIGAIALTASIKHAALMIVSDLYNNRELTSFTEISGNPALVMLLSGLRRLEGSD